jgi:hypothetical protein
MQKGLRAGVKECALRNFLVATALVLGLMVSVVLGAYIYWSYASAADPGMAVPQTAAANQAQEGEGPGETAAEPIDSVFVHRATPESISSNSTYLDNRLINGNPDAILSVTQNWNPRGDGTYNAHSVGVWYDDSVERWAIFNEDRAAMPEGAAFNVVVAAAPASTR